MKVLRNCWYAAAWSDEVKTGTLFPLRILDQAVVMFRKQEGTVVAIADFCPHRFAPLHRGRQIGDVVQCGYHGLEFDGNGQCVRNPHEQGNLPRASVPAFAVEDRHSVIWIWIGDEPADPGLISDEFAFLASPDRAHVRGRFHVKGNYQLLLDNLLDISHALYLHGDALMTEDLYAGFDPKTQVEGDEIKVTMEVRNITAPGLFCPALPPGTEKTDLHDYVKYVRPSMVTHDIAYTQPGADLYLSTGVSSRSAHLFTPETESTTHYLFDNSRDFMLADDATDERMFGALKKAFGEEDIPMIEAQQAVIGDRNLLDLRPAILVNDRTAVLVRRTMAKWINEQDKAAALVEPMPDRALIPAV